MRYLKFAMALIFLAMPILASQASAQSSQNGQYWYRSDNGPGIDIWTNKGDNSTYYFGEDVAVYLKADQDCYVVVYDIDPSGDVHILYPSSIDGSTFVRGGDLYRIPDANSEYKLEVADNSGLDRIYAVASYDYINSPDFIRYFGYDYGNASDYNDNYFVVKAHGDLDSFVDDINSRITTTNYSVAYTKFNVDDGYRNASYYRYANYPPYDVSSVWVGCDFPGSEIWIDGIFYGYAPVLVPRIFVGYHWVWAYYGGYPCYQQYFYVPRYHRFDLNIHVDNRYRDGRYRHDEFHRWAFDQRPVRNSPGFVKDARQLQEKSIRTRSIPSGVVRDYVDRGIMTRDNPLAKGVRTTSGLDRNPGTPIIAPNYGTRDRNGNSTILKPGAANNGSKGPAASNPNLGRSRGETNRGTGNGNIGKEAQPSRERAPRGNNNRNGNKQILTPSTPERQSPQVPSQKTPSVRQREQVPATNRNSGENSSQAAKNVQREQIRQAEQQHQTQQAPAEKSNDNGNYKQSGNSDRGGQAEKAPRNENSSKGNDGGHGSRGRR